MMHVVKVTVDFDYNEIMFARKDFLFRTMSDAEAFCHMIEQKTKWRYSSPVRCQTEEIFTPETAFWWIKDEIEKADVAA